jgi:hypothetical protein
MAKRCGDLAEFRFKVKSKSVGKTAVTKVLRAKDNNLTASFAETLSKAEDKKIRWPDLPDKSGAFYGGRKPDFKGLDKKSYKDKFTEQEFMLELFVEGVKKKSTAGHLKINGYADVGDDHKSIGIPMATQMWTSQATVGPTGAVTPGVMSWSDPTGTSWQNNPSGKSNCGDFHLSVKDGVVGIKVKIELLGAGIRKGLVFRSVKKLAEAFWNGPSGYRQWVYHRKNCRRKDDCDCAVVSNSKYVYSRTGCCKVPVRLTVEQGADNKVNVHFLPLAQRFQLLTKGVVPGLRANTLNFYYPENNPHTFAHEVGHMMGFPDQYWYGIVAAGSMGTNGAPTGGSAFPIDPNSIMGQSMSQATTVHINAKWIFDWINANVDDMKPLAV